MNNPTIEKTEIYDEEDDITYTAHIEYNNDKWIGYIEEYPKVSCQTDTKESLLTILEQTLYRTLEEDWIAWDKEIEEDAKAGRLDWLLPKNDERYSTIEEFLASTIEGQEAKELAEEAERLKQA